MAAVDYTGILQAFAEIIKADVRIVDGVQVLVEQNPVMGQGDDGGRAIVLMRNSRRLDAGQAMAAGKRTRYIFSWSAWVSCFDMNSYEEACKKCDDLLGILEQVLMDNRTITGKVTASQLGGGDFLSSRSADESAFVAMAETRIESEVSVINP